MANSNLGNGNLRPETFGETRQELPLRIAGPPTETGPWRGKLRKCRAILRRRKSCRFCADYLVADAVASNRSPLIPLARTPRRRAVTRVTPPRTFQPEASHGCVFFGHPAIVRQALFTRAARCSSALEERAQLRRREHGHCQLDRSWADRGFHREQNPQQNRSSGASASHSKSFSRWGNIDPQGDAHDLCASARRGR